MTTFELSNYNNSIVTLGNVFKSSLTIGSSKKDKSSKDESDYEFEDNMDDIDVSLSRRLPRDKGKFKGKLPLIYFKCHEVGHFEGKCPNKRRNDKYESRDKYKGNRGQIVFACKFYNLLLFWLIKSMK